MVTTRNSSNKSQKRSVQLTPDRTKNKEEIETSPYSGRKMKLHKEMEDGDKSKKPQKDIEIIDPPKLKKVETSVNVISPCKNFTREINVQSQKYTPESLSPFDNNGDERSFQHKKVYKWLGVDFSNGEKKEILPTSDEVYKALENLIKKELVEGDEIEILKMIMDVQNSEQDQLRTGNIFKQCLIHCIFKLKGNGIKVASTKPMKNDLKNGSKGLTDTKNNSDKLVDLSEVEMKTVAEVEKQAAKMNKNEEKKNATKSTESNKKAGQIKKWKM